jgi:hypothetical protein
MPSRTRRKRLVGTSLLVLAFLPGLSSIAFAGDPPSSAGAAEDASVAAPEEAAEADQVYVLNGATISWDLEGRRFRPPTEAQAAELARQFRAWMEARMGGEAPPPVKEIEAVELPNGLRRARLPIHMMNAAMVSVGPDGELAGMCTEGAEGAAEALAAPAAASREVRK